MNCEHVRDLIVKQLVSSAEASDAEALNAHLQDCESCRHYKTESLGTWTALDSLTESAPAASHTEEIMKRIRARPSAQALKANQAEPPANWQARLLAAGVMLALGIGLFALVLRRDPTLVKAPPPVKTVTPADDGSAEKKDDAPKPAVPELTAAEIDSILKLFKKLDADDFDVRSDASRQLIAMGSKVTPWLKARLDKRDPDDSEHLRQEMKTAIEGISKAEAEKLIKAALDGLNEAVALAPKKFIAPDPDTVEKLNQRVSFEFSDQSLEDCVTFIREKTGVTFFIDPRLDAAGVMKTPITLRVNNMAAELALAWMMKLADEAFVVRGKAVIVTDHGSAEKLSLQSRTYKLPIGTAQSPWTADETNRLAALVQQGIPVQKENYTDMIRPAAVLTGQAGEMEIHANAGTHSYVKTFFDGLSKVPPYEPPLPLAAREKLEQGVNAKVRVDWKAVRLEKAIHELSTQSGVPIIFDPKLVDLYKEKITLAAEEKLNVLLLKICELRDLSVCPMVNEEPGPPPVKQYSLWLTFHDPRNGPQSSLCIFDLNPALNAKIPLAELEKALHALGSDNGQVIHGLWFANIDEWTAGRAGTRLAEAAKTGRITEVPPAPWFFESLRPRPPKPPPEPPKQAPIPKTPDLDGNPNGDDGK